ncbi:class I SAM-dependent methyltransferase [Alsobacter sp. R-9]
MSGFSPDWLALREPADHRARDAGLARRLSSWLSARPDVRVLDMGCGTGSNLRALMPLLPARQAWTLVDWDARLLDAARARLCAWAEHHRETADGIVIAREGREAAVSFRQADLTKDLDACLDLRPDLVTAAALFDLVSTAWIEGFAGSMAARSLPLYTVLTYDGTEEWSPPHPLDAAVLSAFHAHQGTDKGFGPAAGPAAGNALAEAFGRAGYSVGTASSPWRLGSTDAGLVRELASGIAGAAAETGRVTAEDAKAWADARAGASAVVGHVDILALPPG